MLVPRLWTLDSVCIATKRLKIHNKKVQRRESSVEPHQPLVLYHKLLATSNSLLVTLRAS
jgi:hypothetical protein